MRVTRRSVTAPKQEARYHRRALLNFDFGDDAGDRRRYFHCRLICIDLRHDFVCRDVLANFEPSAESGRCHQIAKIGYTNFSFVIPNLLTLATALK